MASLSFIESKKLRDLIAQADPDGQMKAVLTNGRLAIGSDPLAPVFAIDFSAEAILPFMPANGLPPARRERSRRRADRYGFTLFGKYYPARSLKDLLKTGLLAIEQCVPGTLERLSDIKPYSKRIVARDKALLFDTAHLADDFSERLNAEWWVGTNNSMQEVRAWLGRAVTCASLRWDRDFTLKL